MNQKHSQSLLNLWLFTLPAILALISLGCGLSSALASYLGNEPENSAPTRIPLPTFTPTPINIVAVDTIPTDTPTEEAPTEQGQAPPEVTEPQSVIPSPTPPPAPTEESAATNSGPAIVTVVQNMNVRSGPGTNYPVIGSAPPGASAPATGRNADSSWVQVEYPPGSGNQASLYASLVQIDGGLENVPLVQAPAPPPAAPAQPAEQPPAEQPPPAPEPPKYQFTPTAWSASGNEAIIHFRGTIRDEAGNPVNGFSALVDNGSWSVLAHPTGASHHYPEKPDGEWDVVIPDVRTGIGWWTITVVSYDCPDFNTFFNAQCKQFTRLSEDVKIEVVYPDETIIWADWVCHWDCDKGLYVDAYRRP